MNKLYIVIALLPKEPHIIYYCGTHGILFSEAAGMVKRMPLKEAEEVFSHVGAKDKKIKFSLMEWETFTNVYQFTATSLNSFVESSIKTK